MSCANASWSLKTFQEIRKTTSCFRSGVPFQPGLVPRYPCCSQQTEPTYVERKTPLTHLLAQKPYRPLAPATQKLEPTLRLGVSGAGSCQLCICTVLGPTKHVHLKDEEHQGLATAAAQTLLTAVLRHAKLVLPRAVVSRFSEKAPFSHFRFSLYR
jgi:hypothetical protein